MGISLTRGYKPVREKVTKSSRYLRSCDNCKYYFETSDDDGEELCQNNNVLEFDICNDNGRIYCAFWEGMSK